MTMVSSSSAEGFAMSQEQFASLEDGQQRLEGRLDHVDRRLDRIEGQLAGVDGRLDTLETGQVELRQALDARTDDLARQMRVLHEDVIDRLHAIADPTHMR